MPPIVAFLALLVRGFASDESWDEISRAITSTWRHNTNGLWVNETRTVSYWRS